MLNYFTIINIGWGSFASNLLSPHAYLDPGSGSFIIQLIVASLMGALFRLGVYWKKVKSFLSSIFKSEKDDNANGQ